LKCRQIANGGLYGGTPEDRSQFFIHDAKTDAVESIVEELGGKPCLIATSFEHDRDRLLERFGSDTPWIGGGVPPRRFKELEEAWNLGALPILLAQPQSVAHGLNLQGVPSAIVKMALTWNLEDDDQFTRRVWRQGRKSGWWSTPSSPRTRSMRW